mgnify:CR=1 FL=1
MTKLQVLFVDHPNYDSPEYRDFSSRYDCIHYSLTTKEQLIYDLNTQFKNIVAIYGGWIGFSSIGGCPQDLIDHIPRSVQIFALCSIGYNGYDLAGLSARNIALTNAPSNIASNSVADLVLYNSLQSFRNFQIVAANVGGKLNQSSVLRYSLKHGKFDQESGKAVISPQDGTSFGDLTCGRPNLSPMGANAVIVGFGSIGQIIGQRLSSIGMNIHYVKRTELSQSEAESLGYRSTYHSSLQQTTGFADLVIIACPGGPSTKHLINEQIINDMAKPFRIINIGRGTSVDEHALVAGLKSGKVLFAGLDVFEEEPQIHPELVGRQDVVITPHIGSGTHENFNYTMKLAFDNIDNVINGNDEHITRVN